MTKTLLQTVLELADHDGSPETWKAVATIARKLATKASPADKVHAITTTLRKLEELEQERIVSAFGRLALKGSDG